MKLIPRIAAVPLALLLAATANSAANERPSPEKDLMAVIAPSAKEQAWLAIPWETDLTEARRKAAAEGKPIFLWEMDGHPLGCT